MTFAASCCTRATLALGKRHVVPWRTFYFEEDTWAITTIDGYDADAKLWRTSQSFAIAAPEVPAINADPTIVYNLQAETYSVIPFLNGEYWRSVPPRPNAFFTGDSLASQGGR